MKSKRSTSKCNYGSTCTASCSRRWQCTCLLSTYSRPRWFPTSGSELCILLYCIGLANAWLILRDLCSPKLSAFPIHALDPYSRSWHSIIRHSISERPFEMVGPCFLRCSKGDRLYSLLFRKMAISKDPFGAKWEQDTKAPRKFRLDPAVAEVGRWVLIMGGECSIERDYEEEGSVEIYDKQTGNWKSTELMPVVYEGSTSAAWLSIVATSKRMYIIERKTGWLSWFDPENKRWGPTSQLRLDPAVSAWAITNGTNEKELLLVGVGRLSGGEPGGGVKVRFWGVDGNNLWVLDNEFEEMPREMVDRLFPSDKGHDATWQDYSVDVCGTENGGYVCNPLEMRNGVVRFDLGMGRRKIEKGRNMIVDEWEWVPLPERVGDNPMGRILCGCSPVDLSDVSSSLHERVSSEFALTQKQIF